MNKAVHCAKLFLASSTPKHTQTHPRLRRRSQMEHLTTQLTELFAAIQASNLVQIRRLLAANVSPNQCNAEGKTALMVAAQLGDRDVIQLLCNAAAADQPRPAQIFLANIITPIPTALSPNSPSFVAIPTYSARSLESAALKENSDESFSQWTERSLNSILEGQFERSPQLDPFPDKLPDRLPDRLSDRFSDQLSGRLSDQPSGRLSNQLSDGSLERSLEAAVFQNDVSTVEALLKAGAKFRPATWYDTPLLVTAAAKGYADIVQALIVAGANVNSGYDRLPLHVAAENGHLTVVQRLLNSGACLQDREESGRTALMAAAAGGHLPIVKTLVARGADINAACRGETAQMLASQNGHQAIQQFLCTVAYA